MIKLYYIKIKLGYMKNKINYITIEYKVVLNTPSYLDPHSQCLTRRKTNTKTKKFIAPRSVRSKEMLRIGILTSLSVP